MRTAFSYAAHGSPEFNARLQQTFNAITAATRTALGSSLVALILGGGYGRGEGAVVRVEDTEQPYNDFDFFLVLTRARRQAPLQAVSAHYAAELGIHVDFSRPLTINAIQRWPHWLMWHDLLNGHQVLFGPSDILSANSPPVVSEPVPLIEATRLLLNRGAGLLWAIRVTQGCGPTPDPDFVRRNYWKSALALGDALLIMHRRYTTAYRGRDSLLANLANEPDCCVPEGLTSLYEEALRFKFSPGTFPPVSRTALERLSDLWQTVFLTVESTRTGITWQDSSHYATWSGSREPEQNGPAAWLPNLVRNARYGSCSPRHPRERLYRLLPRLLSSGPGGNWPDRSARFLAIWERFN